MKPQGALHRTCGMYLLCFCSDVGKLSEHGHGGCFNDLNVLTLGRYQNSRRSRRCSSGRGCCAHCNECCSLQSCSLVPLQHWIEGSWKTNRQDNNMN